MASNSQVTIFSVSGVKQSIINNIFSGNSDIFRNVIVVTASPQGTVTTVKGVFAVSSAGTPVTHCVWLKTSAGDTDWLKISSS